MEPIERDRGSLLGLAARDALSLEAALWALDRGSSFRVAALLAVNLGDDADTTGAVFGQLAGAVHGEGGIPQSGESGSRCVRRSNPSPNAFTGWRSTGRRAAPSPVPSGTRNHPTWKGSPMAQILRRGSLVLALAFVFLVSPGIPRFSSADERTPPFDPTTRYEARQVEGWTVLVNRGFLEGAPELADRTLTLLRDQLYQVGRRVPGRALKTLRTIRIWVEEREPHHPCMAYHPDAGWLAEHGMNPEKARCVEVANARTFLTWTVEQPWMVLHELAHGYHHQALVDGHENPEVRDLHQQAIAGKLYESVLHINGSEGPAYAATNPMEYFAEGSEAFFGTNDFYPFVRSELRRHDPRLYKFLETAWHRE